MIYDIYKQDVDEKQDAPGNRKVIRFHTFSMKKAFMFMNEKNKVAQKNIWRVAVQINNRIFFDIDTNILENVIRIREYYEKLFGFRFVLFKTYHGYHLKSFEKYQDKLQWQYDTCRVCNPLLEKENLQKYIVEVHKFYKAQLKEQKVNGYTHDEFIEVVSKRFVESGLYCGVGEFDILFAINVILKGYYCIRISKKAKDDNPYEITI